MRFAPSAGWTDRDGREVEVRDRWKEPMLSAPPRLIIGLDCTPGHYNEEGQEPTPAMRRAVGYPAGPSAYLRYLAKWHDDATFAGLTYG